MGIFLNTAAYGYNPVVGSAFCTATSQTAGYTYYKAASFIDVSIPEWTIRVLNSLTSSLTGAGSGIGCYFFSCNAQYSTASYGGAQSNSNVSTRVTNGAVRAYGLCGILKSITTTDFCYTDSIDSLASGNECSRVYAIAYGSGVQNQLYLYRDYTQYRAAFATPTWGNQPFENKCSTYTMASNGSINYISCSNNTAYTSSGTPPNSGSYCARQFQYLGGSAGVVSITNYYSSSCGTY